MSIKKVVIGVAAVAAIVLGSALPAAAHVTIYPDTGTKGDEGTFTFRMPNEEDSANATKLEVDIPTDHPIASVDVLPQDGWTYAVTNTNLPAPIKTDDGSVSQAVSQIIWTATGDGAKPGEYAAFNVLLDSLPSDTNQIEFKAVQTYSNGDVVRWIDDTPANGPEPEHPAPVLTLTAGDDSMASSAAMGGGGPMDAASATTTTTHNKTSGTAIAALIVAIVGTVIAVIAFIRTIVIAIQARKVRS